MYIHISFIYLKTANYLRSGQQLLR